MIPAASSAGFAVKTVQPTPHNSAARAQPSAPEAARTSAGETSAANVALQSAKAVTAPEQSAVAPRLRDHETADHTDRTSATKDAPTGPPPAFEESPLERQARVAFDPPETPPEPAFDLLADNAVVAKPDEGKEESAPEPNMPDTRVAPPPTPTERAEASFAETKTLAEPKEAVTVDVAR